MRGLTLPKGEAFWNAPKMTPELLIVPGQKWAVAFPALNLTSGRITGEETGAGMDPAITRGILWLGSLGVKRHGEQRCQQKSKWSPKLTHMVWYLCPGRHPTGVGQLPVAYGMKTHKMGTTAGLNSAIMEICPNKPVLVHEPYTGMMVEGPGMGPVAGTRAGSTAREGSSGRVMSTSSSSEEDTKGGWVLQGDLFLDFGWRKVESSSCFPFSF